MEEIIRKNDKITIEGVLQTSCIVPASISPETGPTIAIDGDAPSLGLGLRPALMMDAFECSSFPLLHWPFPAQRLH